MVSVCESFYSLQDFLVTDCQLIIWIIIDQLPYYYFRKHPHLSDFSTVR